MSGVVVTGGTGFVGRALVDALVRRGEAVTLFTRAGGDAATPRATSIQGGPGGPRSAAAPVTRVAWTPLTPGPWQATLDGARAVVHLAGEQAVGARWTDAVRARIRDSRVRSAELLVEGMAALPPERRPRVLVTASGVGFYGARRDDAECDEGAPAGDDFLAQVCVAWEGAAREAEALGVRVVMARLGVVLGPGGGALEQMALPFRAFAGGPVGSGQQWFPWVQLDDAVAALLLALEDETVSGPVNVVAPGVVRQGELARALGVALGRPSWLPVPAAALRLRFGEGAEPLLTGQRAVPRALTAHGFTFRHPALASALGVSL